MSWIGRSLGRYRILAKLGEGGMGEVYRALDTELEREVALKILPARVTSDAEARARFVREARAVANLSHPNILSIFDFSGGEEAVYAVTELLEGETLAERLRRARALSWREAALFGRAIAEGLAAAHAKGIVHRDLKPANVFLTRSGQVKILDFGLAKRTRPPLDIASGDSADTPTFRLDDSGSSDREATLRTSPGIILGTVGYMAPEQVRGHEADARTDLFALGCLLHELASGRRPFDRETPIDTLSAILKDEPPTLDGGEVPEGFADLVRRCLAKNPGDRFGSAGEVVAALGRLLDGEPAGTASGRRAPLPPPGSGVAAPPSVAPPPSAPAPRRRGRLVPVLVALLLLGSTALVVRWRLAARESPPPRVVEMKQLTEGPELEGSPSLSRDGKTVVYSGGEFGHADIFRQRVGGTNRMNLTADFPGDDGQPALSPDEQWVAFRSERDGGGIFVMGATGESVRRLTTFGFHPAWSPDGKRIAFATDFSPVPSTRSRKSRLLVVDLAGGEPRPLFDGDAVDPVFSPDGKWIAFAGVAPSTTQLDLFVLPSGGGTPVALTSDPYVDWSPAWSPDGHLVFASNRGGDLSLWRIAVDRSGHAPSPPEPVTSAAGASQSQPSLSADGHLVAHTRSLLGSGIWSVDFDPVRARPVGEPRPLTELPGRWLTPTRSPDGRWIAYVSTRPREDLFVAKGDGSDRRPLTDDEAFDRWPRFTPDGKWIVFYSNRSGRSSAWRAAPDGSRVEPLVDEPGLGVVLPVVSPDGRLLAFLDPTAKRTRIRRLEPPSTAAEDRLLPAPAGGKSFLPTDWSPDGHRLAGHLQSESSAQGGVLDGLAVFDLDGERWSFPADEGLSPRWLPDGRRLLYWRRGNLEVVDREGGPSEVAVTLPSPTPHAGFELSADGKHLLLGRHAFESDIWLARIE